MSEIDPDQIPTSQEYSCDLLTISMEQRMRLQQPFACYRLPHRDGQVMTLGVLQRATVEPLTPASLQERRGVAGFLIAPFVRSADSPMLLISDPSGDSPIELTLSDDLESIAPPSGYTIPTDLPEGYRRAFGEVMEALQRGDAEKVVLAHRMELPSLPTAQLVCAFCRAIRCYPEAFVTLYYTPQSGLWLSATPEMLLRGERGVWQTVALAGTMCRQGDTMISAWSDKDRREHDYVRRFIAERLAAEGIVYRALPIESIPTGALLHLQTRFELQLPEGYPPLKLAERLHPTPAICGSPQSVAQQIILEEECAPRSYYAGYIGWYEPDERTDLFVHIRCLQLLPEVALRLYAGGGIVLGSTLEREWEEVLHKMSAIYSIV